MRTPSSARPFSVPEKPRSALKRAVPDEESSSEPSSEDASSAPASADLVGRYSVEAAEPALKGLLYTE